MDAPTQLLRKSKMDYENVVWSCIADDGAWLIRVVGVGERTAVLQVLNNETQDIIHEEPTGLSYGAIFGPDIDDVNRWGNRALEIIDSQ